MFIWLFKDSYKMLWIELYEINIYDLPIWESQNNIDFMVDTSIVNPVCVCVSILVRIWVYTDFKIYIHSLGNYKNNVWIHIDMYKCVHNFR